MPMLNMKMMFTIKEMRLTVKTIMNLKIWQLRGFTTFWKENTQSKETNFDVPF